MEVMMKLFALKLALIILITSLPILGGCTKVMQASQVGGTEQATWIYIKASRERRNGVFRCQVQENGAPVCTRAQMHYDRNAAFNRQ